ncbi:hypothetical protein AQJ30_20170 [Streptomyces longwoodensis]|uniref:Uncharacterized protein n=1 Tax=Streptomyces longwoodensis TaxID=68231 RepID=A0A101QV34_9ACTN|nr:hypothetical protein AQJ30_20170 [Streptomyces longwoodensis]
MRARVRAMGRGVGAGIGWGHERGDEHTLRERFEDPWVAWNALRTVVSRREPRGPVATEVSRH